jgi:hypothetical protein
MPCEQNKRTLFKMLKLGLSFKRKMHSSMVGSREVAPFRYRLYDASLNPLVLILSEPSSPLLKFIDDEGIGSKGISRHLVFLGTRHSKEL